jgi:hypothetical protein
MKFSIENKAADALSRRPRLRESGENCAITNSPLPGCTSFKLVMNMMCRLTRFSRV